MVININREAALKQHLHCAPTIIPDLICHPNQTTTYLPDLPDSIIRSGYGFIDFPSFYLIHVVTLFLYVKTHLNDAPVPEQRKPD